MPISFVLKTLRAIADGEVVCTPLSPAQLAEIHALEAADPLTASVLERLRKLVGAPPAPGETHSLRRLTQ